MAVRFLRAAQLEAWAEQIGAQLQACPAHGDQATWQAAIAAFPALATHTLQIQQGALQIGRLAESTVAQRAQLQAALQQLHPWRKGPYQLYGVAIDSEWRSDWKWERLAEHIDPLTGRSVLDVGCGNGYHGWHMLAAGAERVLGIDPTALYHAQFQAIYQMLTTVTNGNDWSQRICHLPVGVEQIPPQLKAWDTVFSMGVLYHRRSPIEHLQTLRETLRPGGQLVLETLVLEGTAQQVLVPTWRYAKMRNVWFIPSIPLLTTWLQRCGYRNIKTIDVTLTRAAEQRRTDWMRFESLADFLHPEDANHTIEGYPAPRRAILLAHA